MKGSNKKIAGTLLFISLVISLVTMVDKSTFKLDKVDVKISGANTIMVERIRKNIHPFAASLVGSYIWEVSLDDVVKEVTKDSSVAKVKLRRGLPNKLELRIEPHVPQAMILEGGENLYGVAQGGELMPPIEVKQILDLPILRGTQFIKDKELRKLAMDLLAVVPEKGSLTKNKVSEVFMTTKFS